MNSKCTASVKQLEKQRTIWLQEAALEELKVRATQKGLLANADTAQAEQREAAELRKRVEEAALASILCKTLLDVIPDDPKEVRRRLQLEKSPRT